MIKVVSMKIKKNSWTWFLATNNGSDPLPNNFCGLFWKVSLNGILCAIASYFALFIIGTLLGELAALVVTGVFVPMSMLTALLFILAVFSIFLILITIGYFTLSEDGRSH